MTKLYLLIGIVSGLVISLFFGVRSSLVYGDETNRIYFFFLSFFASLMIYLPAFTGLIMGIDFISRKLSKKFSKIEIDEE